MRKQTKLWKMKNGNKIRICDMEDQHLLNTIKMIQCYTKQQERKLLANLWTMDGWITGEQASYCLDQDIAILEEEGLDPSEVCPLYDNLFSEAIRRGLNERV